jgi:tetratricopeptide (TPR) repeat protein
VNLSAYYNRTGDHAAALEQARKAVALDPKSDRAWFQKGRAEERGGSLEAAAESLNQAIVLNPRASSYYYVIAGVFRHLGLMEESRKALELFKKLEQESAELDKKRRSAAPPRNPK